MTKIIGIMACTEKGVIGKDNKLPWNYPDELEHFRLTTENSIIIMGRKTYESTPSSLLNKRESIIFSRNLNFKDGSSIVMHSLDEFFIWLKNYDHSKPIFMIGGAEIANLFLEKKILSSFILTKIKYPYEGDTYLNIEYFYNWNKTTIHETNNYTIFSINPSL